jgi:hypothetical protein
MIDSTRYFRIAYAIATGLYVLYVAWLWRRAAVIPSKARDLDGSRQNPPVAGKADSSRSLP